MNKTVRTIKVLLSLAAVCTLLSACTVENASEFHEPQQESDATKAQEEMPPVITEEEPDITVMQQESATVSS